MKKREFITVLVITLIVVVVWVVSDLVHTKSSAQGLPDVKNYTDPVDPNFDQDTLNKISSLSTPAPAPSGAPVATAAPTASPSATPSPRTTPRPSSSPTSGNPVSAQATISGILNP